MVLEVTRLECGTEDRTPKLNQGPRRSPRPMGVWTRQSSVAWGTAFSVRLRVHKM